MYTKQHQGVVKKTVVLEFENNYSIKLEAGVEMAMFLAMPEEGAIRAAAKDAKEIIDYYILGNSVLKRELDKESKQQIHNLESILGN